MKNKNRVVVKSERLLRAETIMTDIMENLNRDGETTVRTLADKYKVTPSSITQIASFMRKEGVDVPFQRKSAAYKEILSQWKIKKPELFTNYGLKNNKR
jgi:hypothetical protein